MVLLQILYFSLLLLSLIDKQFVEIIIFLLITRVLEKMALQEKDLRELSCSAKKEIGETEVDIVEKIEYLKNVLQENYGNLQLPPNFDDFLLRCLRVRKFDVIRAAKLVSQYFKVNYEMSDMHECFLPSQYAKLYETLGVAVLKSRDSEGRAVVLARQERVPADVYTFDEALAGTLLILDEVVRHSVDTQRIGIAFIVDFKGYSLAHFRQTSPSRLRTAAKLFQDAFPARFKSFHLVRHPFLVGCMYSIVKPFLRGKIKDRIHFHGYNFDALHQHFNPEILPEFLGGKLSDGDYADSSITTRLTKQDSYYKEVLAHGYK